MALTSILPTSIPSSIPTSPLHLLLALSLLTLTSLLLHRLFLHPLSRIPGPPLLALTRLPLLHASWSGHEASYLTSLFARTGSPILRIGPTEVLIADGAALAPIYSSSGGGFDKADVYHNFHIDGFPSLFSATDRAHRAPRARSVLGMFSTKALREEARRGVREAAGAFVARLREARARARAGGGGRVEVLDPARRMAVDVVSGYLFGTSYGATEEGKEVEGEKLSASEFVNAFVGVGRFFFLPTWLFARLDSVSQSLFETEETVQSMDKIDSFLAGIVCGASEGDVTTYQGRMLKAGLSKEEVAAQCKDLMFAGTDSSGMNLSTFCWQMAKHQGFHAKARAEVDAAKASDPDYDPANLPYLRACIKETLRLSMANPTRLPRVVPRGGWTYTPASDYAIQQEEEAAAAAAAAERSKKGHKSYFLPAGTLVSVQIHTMHHNPSVFPDPYEFKPDRWLDSSPAQLERMNRDWIPFSLGSRQCIARNLAMLELNTGCAAVIESGVLEGASNVGDKIEILEWFNSKVEGERIEIEYL